MKRIALLLLALLACSPAQAQSNFGMPPPAGVVVIGAQVVATCGTGSLAATQAFITIDTSGKVCTAASVSASITGFPGTQSTGTPIAVTTGGVTGTLPAGTEVLATNDGATNTAYCKLGASATTSDLPIYPHSSVGFTVGASTQLTCITSTSTTTVNMTGGSGIPTGWGGGSASGGGGGGAITAASGSYASGAMSSGSYASGAFASGSGADGWDVSEGATSATAATAGSTGSVNAKLRLMTTQLDTIATNSAAEIPAATTSPPNTVGGTIPRAGTTGAATPSSAIAPATPAGVNLKASAGTLYVALGTTVQATPVYLKIYDSASAPTCGSGTPVLRIMIPAANTPANGAGTNPPLGPVGIKLTSGIGYCVTGALADSDVSPITANNTLVNFGWN